MPKHPPTRCHFDLTDCELPGASHVVGRTLGSRAYRIGDGGACFCYFNSSWNDSSFLVGSEDLVCWPDSQDWNSLSF